MGEQLNYCGKINGHRFVYICMSYSEKSGPSTDLVRDYHHVRQCDECRSGIAASFREHARSNKKFDHAKFYRTLDQLQQRADKL